MATRTISTTYEAPDYEAKMFELMSEAVRSEISKLLPDQQPKKTILTRQETAKLLDISLPTLNEYTKAGYITACRLGYKVRYKLEDIEQALVRIKIK